MVTIDVLGEAEAAETMDVLASLYGGVRDAQGRLGKFQQKIYIIEDHHAIQGHGMPAILDNDILLVNADDPEIYNYLTGRRGTIITYGFHSKACVTASSVAWSEYQTLQCCIQRALPTLGGHMLEQQEFSVTVGNPDRNVNSILSGVTAALLCDMSVEQISRSVV